MQAILHIDKAFDAAQQRRAECRERVSSLMAGAMAALQTTEPHMSESDRRKLAAQALRTARDARLGAEVRRNKELGRLINTLVAAKQLGSEQVWLDGRDIEML